MRLDDDIQYLKGFGPKRAQSFLASGIKTIRDLLNIVPYKYLSHESAIPINQLKVDDYVTVIGTIMTCGLQRGRRRRFVAMISDGHGICQAVWFNYVHQIQNKINKGDRVALTGRVGFYNGFQIVHPSIEILEADTTVEQETSVIPVYSIPEKLKQMSVSSDFIRKTIKTVLSELEINTVDDQLPESIRDRYGFSDLKSAYQAIHLPSSEDSGILGLARFKFEELFHLQIYLLLKKQIAQHQQNGIRFETLGSHFHSIHDGLNFELTAAQKRVLKEIRRDTMAPYSMNRLVQGDVGSGKTIVAILTLAIAADNGYQSAFMAPTEILAEQHYLNLLKLTDLAGLRVTFLSGSLKESQRKERLQAIANGMTDIVVGTHAVIQKDVHFHKLGMIVIDEQHRFGVMQRAELLEKGNHPDVLVMTATPIPRTLALTVYGDLEVSIIDEMPKGRVPIKTIWRFDNKETEIHQFIIERLKAGEQAYIVYPLIEESEKIDLKSAIEQFERISTGIYSGFKLALLHGRMKADEKEDVMRRFKAGEIQAIISTTVIEVGVDVPNATVMLIENAERFGLSQLHQLRGRVGRGAKQSFCILKTSYRLGDDAKERMEIMCTHLDGFKIAEEDLRLRGIGELFGTRQSGISDLRMANLATDQDWLIKARAEAQQVLEQDPHLRKPEHQSLRKIVMDDYQQRFGLIEIA